MYVRVHGTRTTRDLAARSSWTHPTRGRPARTTAAYSTWNTTAPDATSSDALPTYKHQLTSAPASSTSTSSELSNWLTRRRPNQPRNVSTEQVNLKCELNCVEHFYTSSEPPTQHPATDWQAVAWSKSSRGTRVPGQKDIKNSLPVTVKIRTCVRGWNWQDLQICGRELYKKCIWRPGSARRGPPSS